MITKQKRHQDIAKVGYNHITIHNRLWCLLTEPEPPILGHIWLRQLKLSLTDKLQVLNILDDDIVDATPKDKLAREIEQADEDREEIHLALPCPDLLSIVQWYYLLLSQL